VYTHKQNTTKAQAVKLVALVLKPGQTGDRMSHWTPVGEGATLEDTGLNRLLLWLQAADAASKTWGTVPAVILVPDYFTVQH